MLTTEEKQEMNTYFQSMPLKSYAKNEVIVQPSSVYRHVFFVEKGITRIFYYNAKGEEITHWFAKEHEAISILSSVFDKSKSPYGFQALEDTEIRLVPFELFMEQKRKSEVIANVFEKLLISSAISVANRLTAIQTQTAKERYEQLLKQEPAIFQRVNLGHIASYLGITRQSLSRIRTMK